MDLRTMRRQRQGGRYAHRTFAAARRSGYAGIGYCPGQRRQTAERGYRRVAGRDPAHQSILQWVWGSTAEGVARGSYSAGATVKEIATKKHKNHKNSFCEFCAFSG